MICGSNRSMPAWCRECGRPLGSTESIRAGLCGMCARRKRHVQRTRELEDDWTAPEPWDGWGT